MGKWAICRRKSHADTECSRQAAAPVAERAKVLA